MGKNLLAKLQSQIVQFQIATQWRDCKIKKKICAIMGYEFGV
jgi:hypothetical protein